MNIKIYSQKELLILDKYHDTIILCLSRKGIFNIRHLKITIRIIYNVSTGKWSFLYILNITDLH